GLFSSAIDLILARKIPTSALDFHPGALNPSALRFRSADAWPLPCRPTNEDNRRPPARAKPRTRGVRVDRIGRTSPTRVGSEVPRLNLHVQSARGEVMTEITPAGPDLAKRVVSLCGEDASGRAVVQRTLRREAVLAWFVQRPPCLVGMEACSSAHWFARELAALGHKVRIIAPEFVRPFRLSGKNDTNDAAAICAAVRQPQLRFVTVKSAEQQARLVVHRLRQGWQEERTASLNRLRGLLAEFGRVYPNSAAAALAGARSALADDALPPALRRGVARQLEHLRGLDQCIDECAREIAQDAAADPRARRAARLSGVGVLTASAVAATVIDPQ